MHPSHQGESSQLCAEGCSYPLLGGGKSHTKDAYAQFQPCNAGAQTDGLTWDVLGLGFLLSKELQALTTASPPHSILEITCSSS